MNNDVKETLIKVADYTNTEKEKKKRVDRFRLLV